METKQIILMDKQIEIGETEGICHTFFLLRRRMSHNDIYSNLNSWLEEGIIDFLRIKDNKFHGKNVTCITCGAKREL